MSLELFIVLDNFSIRVHICSLFVAIYFWLSRLSKLENIQGRFLLPVPSLCTYMDGVSPVPMWMQFPEETVTNSVGIWLVRSDSIFSRASGVKRLSLIFQWKEERNPRGFVKT